VHGFYYAISKKDFADLDNTSLPEDHLPEEEDVRDISRTARLDNPRAFEKIVYHHYPESDDEPSTKIHHKRLVDLPVSELNARYAGTDEGLPISGGDIAKMENQAIPVNTYEEGLVTNSKSPVRDVSRLRAFMDTAYNKRRKPEYGNDLTDPEHNEY
jgi:hypothetical protein